jgi:hypothetical protein
VRIAVGRASTRRAAFFQLAFVGLLFLLTLCLAGLQPVGESPLGKVVFSLWLTAAVLNLAVALWVWRAIRWVDRNDRWG